jgi:phosphatidate cytidylyltransferase
MTAAIQRTDNNTVTATSKAQLDTAKKNKKTHGRLVNFLQRIYTSAILITVFVCSIIFSPIPFFCLVIIANVIAIIEFRHALRQIDMHLDIVILIVCAITITFGTLNYKTLGMISSYIFSIAFIILYFAIKRISFIGRIRYISASIFIISYIPLFSSFLILLILSDNGPVWTALAIAIPLMNDLGGYAIGSFIGKHSIFPKISPAKTVEGTIGGLVFAIGLSYFIIYAMQFLGWYNIPIYWFQPLLLGLVSFLFGTTGDLLESKIKRIAKIKDSSNLLLGHGGVLDRIDSILFSAPFIYFLFQIFFW